MRKHVDDLGLIQLHARDPKTGLQDAGDECEVFRRRVGGRIVDYRCDFADAYRDDIVYDIYDDRRHG